MRKAIGANVERMEYLNPLTNNEERVLRDCFKAEYYHQVRSWVICQEKQKRKRVFRLINGQNSSSVTRPSSFPDIRMDNKEYILTTGNTTINIFSVFNKKNETRRVNKNRFMSTGVRDCFSPDAELTTRRAESRCENLSSFLVKRLMNEEYASKLGKLSDDEHTLVQEIMECVEKRGNQYPIDQMKNHPYLSPDQQRLQTLIKNNEDHFDVKRNHVSVSREKPIQTTWKTPITVYSEKFSDTDTPKTLATTFPPLELSCPYSQFPDMSGKRIKTTSNLYRSVPEAQYRRIFNARTVL